jgi:hypothetical protein
VNLVWAVACRQSIIDIQTNNISLINVLEQVNFATSNEDVDNVPIPLEVVSMWARSNFDEPEKANGRWLLFAPSGDELNNLDFDIDLTQHTRARAITRFMGLPFSGNGIYRFVVQLEENDGLWQTVAMFPLDVIRNTSETDDQTVSEN